MALTSQFVVAAPVLLLGGLGLGCTGVLQETTCDLEAATEVVYDGSGAPAYPGQALIQSNCGGGGLCHGAGDEPSARLGAPLGLDFDLRPAVDDADVSRLAHDQRAVADHFDLFLTSIESGSMPPASSDGLMDESFGWFRRGERVPLPAIDRPGAVEILENFGACGFRVIERVGPFQGETSVGWVADPLEREPAGEPCLEGTWDSIFQELVTRRCNTSVCHDADRPAGDLSLSGSSFEVVARLVDQPAQGPECRGEGHLVVPGDSERSLFYRKLRGDSDVCGRPMPSATRLIDEVMLRSVREWIECGACAASDDPACESCFQAVRATHALNGSCSPGGTR